MADSHPSSAISHPATIVLAVDPGRDKCGVAVVGANGEVLMRRIAAPTQMQDALVHLAQEYSITQVVVGNATTSRAWCEKLSTWLPTIPLAVADETGSTLEARALYWQAHPPRGWRRALPLSLQVPPEPIDDFAAVVLALRFFETAAEAQRRREGLEDSR